MKITGFGPKKLKDSVVYIVFIGIFLLFSVILFDRGFLTSGNLLNIARQSAMIAIMSVGMTFVLCTAEIDLSFGAVVALSAITSALAMRATGSILLSVLAGAGLRIARRGDQWNLCRLGGYSFLPRYAGNYRNRKRRRPLGQPTAVHSHRQ